MWSVNIDRGSDSSDSLVSCLEPEPGAEFRVRRGSGEGGSREEQEWIRNKVGRGRCAFEIHENNIEAIKV